MLKTLSATAAVAATLGLSTPIGIAVTPVQAATTTGAAAAMQQRTFTLTNGRQVVLPTSVPGCTLGEIRNLPTGQIVNFFCDVADVLVIVAAPPLSDAPVALLEDNLSRTFSDFRSWPADQRAVFLSRENRTLAGGTTAPFHCASFDDVAALRGSTNCVLDLPQTELMVTATAPMSSDSAQGVDIVLRHISYR